MKSTGYIIAIIAVLLMVVAPIAKADEPSAVYKALLVKYDANKKRSRVSAEHRSSTMLYVRAQDTPSAEVLRDRPRIAEEKTRSESRETVAAREDRFRALLGIGRRRAGGLQERTSGAE